MKPFLLPLFLSLTLNACSSVGVDGNNISLGLGLGGSIGRHVGLGTSINIPLSIGRGNTTADQSGINIIEEQVLTYFDAQGNTSDSAVKGGFYRQLLSKQNNNLYLVQDFYNTGEKRTEPMSLSREQAFVFRAHPDNGVYTVYAINGNIMLQQNFRNGRLIQ